MAKHKNNLKIEIKKRGAYSSDGRVTIRLTFYKFFNQKENRFLKDFVQTIIYFETETAKKLKKPLTYLGKKHELSQR